MTYKQARKESRRLNETKDCAVVAVAVATNTPYDVIRQMMKKHGRRYRQGTPFWITRKVLEDLGVLVIEQEGLFSARTIGSLKKELPSKGRFLIRTYSHILACVNGEVCDWTDGRRHRIKETYEICF